MPRLSRRLEIVLWIAAFAAIVLIGRYVLPSGQDTAQDREVLRIGYVSWAEGIAMTYLAKAAIEDRFDYDVELTLADPAPIFTSLANRELDVFLDAWLPKTHSNHMEEYGDRLIDLGPNYEGARIGLVVPAYVDLETIPDLAANAARFDGAITGIDSGAGIMETTRRAIAAYDLDMDLLTSSGAAMTASLKDAIQTERPIVVTGWKPHWMFARWQLKFLEDPQGIYGEAESIRTLTRRGLAKDMPEVVSFLRAFSLTDQQIGSLMDNMRQTPSKEEAASAWIREHADLVDSWMP
jgi:glycine betaine/proline transport system substrate-binding protein